ncbi:polymorphic toxin type 22 domain-containing protein [Caballeronia sp. GAWG1-1]|uniref:polymorphic toxin type 22 domain-containing protein n=1 Tax=Caballeronia sp. GAWG1-1 TaxID=2921742 RepID=UPI0020283A4A
MGVSGAGDWDEGGANRIALHVAGGALIGGLGGGSVVTAVGAVAGAGLVSKLANQLDNLSRNVASETGSDLLGTLAANVAASTGGALIGGTAGAATGSAVELYNPNARSEKTGLSKVCSGLSVCNASLVVTAVNADAANSQAALDSISPNYANVSGSILSGTVGGAVKLADGTAYASAGVSQSFPAPAWNPSFAATIGGIFGAHSANATNEFMNGDGNQFAVSIPTPLPLNIVGAITRAFGGATAVEISLGSPSRIAAGITPGVIPVHC